MYSYPHDKNSWKLVAPFTGKGAPYKEYIIQFLLADTTIGKSTGEIARFIADQEGKHIKNVRAVIERNSKVQKGPLIQLQDKSYITVCEGNWVLTFKGFIIALYLVWKKGNEKNIDEVVRIGDEFVRETGIKKEVAEILKTGEVQRLSGLKIDPAYWEFKMQLTKERRFWLLYMEQVKQQILMGNLDRMEPEKLFKAMFTNALLDADAEEQKEIATRGFGIRWK